MPLRQRQEVQELLLAEIVATQQLPETLGSVLSPLGSRINKSRVFNFQPRRGDRS